jgi:hypothetical protein
MTSARHHTARRRSTLAFVLVLAAAALGARCTSDSHGGDGGHDVVVDGVGGQGVGGEGVGGEGAGGEGAGGQGVGGEGTAGQGGHGGAGLGGAGLGGAGGGPSFCYTTVTYPGGTGGSPYVPPPVYTNCIPYPAACAGTPACPCLCQQVCPKYYDNDGTSCACSDTPPVSLRCEHHLP